ncbi:glycosyltransferase [Paenibacillus alba]|uniref:Glycosyltransferase n=1 Tax=Paenibacillus alba TaxID=1197127 RepID=A0ABU6G4W3_9BACL|nr:glycosyltransferase [Paenibacillus alba]MEC0227893.1 glycosyltransferase [Paenibacillus alba]
MKISVCMIVKDEEHNLPKSLSSIPKEFEVVILDTGSSDRSIEVAKKFGAYVYEFTWNDNFSEARNLCAAYATGDYILALDADEVLPEECYEKITSFIGKHQNSVGSVVINNTMDDGNKQHRMLRFYPNQPEFRFAGQVHEQIYDGSQQAEFQDIDLVITHFGYTQEAYIEKNKANRYLPIYLNHLQNNPNDGYMLYQLGKLYYGLEKYTEAEQQLYLSLKINETSALYFPVMVVMLGYVLKERGKFIDAECLLQQHEQNYPLFPDIPFLLGTLAMDTGNISNIEYYFKRALDIGETSKYSTVEGVGTFKAAYNLGVYFEITGDVGSAMHYYRFSADFDYKVAQDRLLELQNSIHNSN